MWYMRRILPDDLNTRRNAAELAPGLLSDDQKQTRLSVCKDLQDQVKKVRHFLFKVM
jgi:hypothetical protein